MLLYVNIFSIISEDGRLQINMQFLESTITKWPKFFIEKGSSLFPYMHLKKKRKHFGHQLRSGGAPLDNQSIGGCHAFPNADYSEIVSMPHEIPFIIMSCSSVSPFIRTL